MNNECRVDVTHEERTHGPIYEVLNALRKRIGDLEDKVSVLEDAHQIDNVSPEAPSCRTAVNR